MRENTKIISIYIKEDKYDIYGFGAKIMVNLKKFLILMELMILALKA